MHIKGLLRDYNVIAWLMLVSSIAIHVFDEAITGFLPFYNDSVATLRERLGFFPAPTFTYGIWLGGLIVAIIIGFGLTIFVARGGRRIRWITIVLGLLMLFNALGHLGGSLYFGRVLPGMWSSPLLLISALFMILRGFRADWPLRQTFPRSSTEQAPAPDGTRRRESGPA
jgi:hypothetical protein